MSRCESCGVFVKDENLWKHYKRVHPKSPLPILPEKQEPIQKPKRIKQPHQPFSTTTKLIAIGLSFLVIVIGLVVYYAPPRDEDCIYSTAYHWNATLLVYEENGNLVTIPPDVGREGCLKTMHTHGANNLVHVESNSVDRLYTVGDFFKLWGRPFGTPQEISVDGQPVETGADTVLRDAITIEIRY